MAWAKNITQDGDGSASVDMPVITSYTFNQIMTHSVESTQNQEFRFNSDSGNNYARRWSSNGSENTGVSQDGSPNAGTSPSLSISYIINISAEEKLIIGFSCNAQTAGAATAPSREEITNKWANTSAQINDLEWKNETTSVNFTSSSNISAIGTD